METMIDDCPHNILIQQSAGHLLERELGWEVAFAHNTEYLVGCMKRKFYY